MQVKHSRSLSVAVAKAILPLWCECIVCQFGQTMKHISNKYVDTFIFDCQKRTNAHTLTHPNADRQNQFFRLTKLRCPFDTWIAVAQFFVRFLFICFIITIMIFFIVAQSQRRKNETYRKPDWHFNKNYIWKQQQISQSSVELQRRKKCTFCREEEET